MLLLLDNCEHLIDAVARLADSILARCPDVAVLATSREPLAIARRDPLAGAISGDAHGRRPKLPAPCPAGTRCPCSANGPGPSTPASP